MVTWLQDPAYERTPAVPDESEPPQVRLGRPGPEALWLALPEHAPLLLTGADLGAHRFLRGLLGDWVQALAATGEVDVLAWAEMDIFMDTTGRSGVSVTPSLGAWLGALRRAFNQGVPRPTVFVGYEVTGTAGEELLAARGGPEIAGPDWHVIWAAPPDSAGGRLAGSLPWRTRIDVEPDARHVVLSRPGQPPERLLAVWDRN
jgi:hypothetical protein